MGVGFCVCRRWVPAHAARVRNDEGESGAWGSPAFACAQAFAPRFGPPDQIAPSAPSLTRDYFVVDRVVGRTGMSRRLWETRLLGDEVRKNQPYFVNI